MVVADDHPLVRDGLRCDLVLMDIRLGPNDVSHLSSGVYFLQAGRASGKVIIGN